MRRGLPVLAMLSAMAGLGQTEDEAGVSVEQCNDCAWRKTSSGGGHCFMFRDAPRGLCGQREADREARS